MPNVRQWARAKPTGSCFRLKRRVPVTLAVPVIVGAFALGVVLPVVAGADSRDGAIQLDMSHRGDAPIGLCAEDGVFSYETGTAAPDGRGLPSPEEAAREYEADIREDASLEGLDRALGSDVTSELRDLLAPSQMFRTTRVTVSGDGSAYYFDHPSPAGDSLEARLIVAQLPAGGWGVEESYICESQISTDLERYQALYGAAVAGVDSPSEPAPAIPESEDE